MGLWTPQCEGVSVPFTDGRSVPQPAVSVVGMALSAAVIVSDAAQHDAKVTCESYLCRLQNAAHAAMAAPSGAEAAPRGKEDTDLRLIVTGKLPQIIDSGFRLWEEDSALASYLCL